MKSLFFTSLFCMILLSCGKDDETLDTDNPNLINPLINLTLNLNLPQYEPLKFPGNSVIVTQQGIRGIVIYNVNNDLYNAFELSDPNHPPANCSRMELNGVFAECPCPNDDNEYNIISGLHNTDPSLYPMQRYRAERTGDNIRVFN